MKNGVKRSLSRTLGSNVDLNRKSLAMKRSFDEVAKLLQIDKASKKK